MAIGDAAWCAARKREHEIHCPYCDAIYDYSEDHSVVTYWGEDGPQECTCRCEKTFIVNEHVDRTWETSKTGGPDDSGVE